MFLRCFLHSLPVEKTGMQYRPLTYSTTLSPTPNPIMHHIAGVAGCMAREGEGERRERGRASPGGDGNMGVGGRGVARGRGEKESLDHFSPLCATKKYVCMYVRMYVCMHACIACMYV